MASIYKRSSAKGKKRTAWYISYFDHTGRRRTRKGYSDKGQTERLAAKLEEEAQLIRDGFKLPGDESDAKPMTVHLTDFERHLRNRDVSDEQIEIVCSRLRKMIEACQWERSVQIRPAEIENYLGARRVDGLSKQTSNHYVRSIKQFCKWMVDTKRMPESPVASIPTLNAKTDRRHARRPLSGDEFAKLVAAAELGKSIESIPGPDRAMMYILSAWTGYRKGEIGSLTLSSFDLEGDPPTVTVEAQYCKRKRRDTQALHVDVVIRFREWLAASRDVAPKSALFPVSAKFPGGVDRKTAKMMRRDLAAARKDWIEQAETDKERALRESSDFLVYKDSQGRFADFHANRHTFITNLSRAGVSPKTAQTLARHSDIRLTLDIYTHTDLAEKFDAVGRLPAPPKSNLSSSKKPEVTTGCQNGVQHLSSARESQDGTNGHPTSEAGRESLPEVDEEASSEVVGRSEVSTPCRDLTPPDQSAPGRTRTSNPWFRRPVLYPIELRALSRHSISRWRGRKPWAEPCDSKPVANTVAQAKTVAQACRATG